jgi:FkbM family methyltransferase
MLYTPAPVRSILDETDRLLARMVPRPLRVPLHAAALRLARRGERAMLSRLCDLCPPTGRALDVGANHGMYTFPLVRRAAFVDAFEPQEQCARNLRAFGAVFAKNLSVHQFALSDAAGTADLHVPLFAGRLGKATISGLASLDLEFGWSESLPVVCKRIDDFRFTDVSFIKIDVEGHETRVIAGAVETLERCRPIVLIEIEQRHLSIPIADVFARLEHLGYRGGFYRRDGFHALDTFDLARDQTSLLGEIDEAVAEERYINMFVFRHA